MRIFGKKFRIGLEFESLGYQKHYKFKYTTLIL